MGKEANSQVTNWTNNITSGGAARHGGHSEEWGRDWELKSDLRYLRGSNVTPPHQQKAQVWEGVNVSQMFMLIYQITLLHQSNSLNKP